MSQPIGTTTYTGVWTNWSAGNRVLGATITLSPRDGLLLTSFLSIFVTVAGTSCWKILSFTLHQFQCRRDYQDGLHRQSQLILRNETSATGSAWQLVQLMWAWRKKASRSAIRTLPFVLVALLNAAFFGVAGIFASQIVNAAGDETLIRSPSCGYLDLNNSTISGITGTQEALTQVFLSQDTNDTAQASAYAKACYGSSPDPFQCNQFAQAAIPWMTNANATCPFGDGLCWWGESGAYEMDSGLIDSHEALGINAKKSDRMQLRKVTTCSPIHTKNDVQTVNVTDPSLGGEVGDVLDQFFFGPIVNGSNYTYSFNEHSLVEQHGYEL